jgi:hypothetical protein
LLHYRSMRTDANGRTPSVKTTTLPPVARSTATQ